MMQPALSMFKNVNETVASCAVALTSSIKKNFVNRPHVEVERGPYLVKTVSTRKEYLQVLRLRYEVFHKEYCGKTAKLGFDQDVYDNYADHLIIVDKASGKVVGTYRMICDVSPEDYYTASEFEIEPLKDLVGRKVELSRACVHPNYRNGTVMTLLWRGLTSYIQAVQADYLFGLASIKTMDEGEISKFIQYFNQVGAVDDTISLKPLPHCAPHKPYTTFAPYTEEELNAVAAEVPTLLKSYMRAGAKVYIEPAIDRDFRCTDFVTILRITSLKDDFNRRYGVVN